MSVYKSVDSTKYAGHWKRRKLQKFYPLKSLSEWKQWLMGRNLQREKKKKAEICQQAQQENQVIEGTEADSFKTDTVLMLLHLQSSNCLVSIQKWQEKRQQCSLVASPVNHINLYFKLKCANQTVSLATNNSVFIHSVEG